jgi:hypothetical protein
MLVNVNSLKVLLKNKLPTSIKVKSMKVKLQVIKCKTFDDHTIYESEVNEG